MSQTFTVNHQNEQFELHYSDIKNRKLEKICKVKTVKGLETAAIVSIVVFALVFVYDYFKDYMRNISATKDLFNNQGSILKIFGFTKGNMIRTMVKFGLLVISFLFFYFSKKEVYCIDDISLVEIGKDIVYENDIPIKFKSMRFL